MSKVRAVWKGAIRFGMVVIPVKLYPATEDKTLVFSPLHRKCLSKAKQVRYCASCDEYVDWHDVVKGYEYARDQYVVLEESEFRRIPVKTTNVIEIIGFVKASDITPLYYQRSYYLEPNEPEAKRFVLIREALVTTNRIAIAKVTFHMREQLCCLRPFAATIMLHTMYYEDEIRPTIDLALPKVQAKIAPEELKMATTLIKSMAKPFEPGTYKDEYRAALQRVIKAKIHGEEIKAPPIPSDKVMDLMSALRASIENAKKNAATTREAVQPPEGVPVRSKSARKGE